MSTQHIETVIIGAGQAGLSTAYHLTTQGRDCLVLDRNARVGDNWRQQWDTPAALHAREVRRAPGLPVPGRSVGVPAEGRGGRLPGELRDSIRRSRCAPTRSSTGSSPAPGAATSLTLGDDAHHLRQRRGRHRHLRPRRPTSPPSPPTSRTGDPAAALERVPSSWPAADRSRARRRRLPLRLRHRLRGRPEHPTILCGPDRGQIPVRLESRRARAVLPVICSSWLVTC